MICLIRYIKYKRWLLLNVLLALLDEQTALSCATTEVVGTSVKGNILRPASLTCCQVNVFVKVRSGEVEISPINCDFFDLCVWTCCSKDKCSEE